MNPKWNIRLLMLKSPVNIVSLPSDNTFNSELRRSLLKFVGRNFNVDGGRYYTLIRKLFVLGSLFQAKYISIHQLLNQSF